MGREKCARWLAVEHTQRMSDIKLCQKSHGRDKCEGCPDYPLEWEGKKDVVNWPSG